MGDRNNYADKKKVITRTYRGPDRREQEGADTEVDAEITRDAKGNPVLSLRAKTPRRREDDDTLDLLGALNVDSLELEGESTPDSGYNPYQTDED